MKLPHRFTVVALAACMACIIAFVVSVVLTAINTGLTTGFLTRVLPGCREALPLAFVGVILFRPAVLFRVKRTVHAPPAA